MPNYPEIVKELCYLQNRKKKDVLRVAKECRVSTSTVYRWMKRYEELDLQQLTGIRTTIGPKNTSYYRADPDYNYIIDQEISHFKPLQKGDPDNLTSTITGFNRRYLTIKTTHKMIIQRLRTINKYRDLDHQFPLLSYQAIWKRVTSRKDINY